MAKQIKFDCTVPISRASTPLRLHALRVPTCHAFEGSHPLQAVHRSPGGLPYCTSPQGATWVTYLLFTAVPVLCWTHSPLHSPCCPEGCPHEQLHWAQSVLGPRLCSLSELTALQRSQPGHQQAPIAAHFQLCDAGDHLLLHRAPLGLPPHCGQWRDAVLSHCLRESLLQRLGACQEWGLRV